MGRLSRYKKVKSVDPSAKNSTWTNGVGSIERKVKKRSKTATRMKEQKLNRKLKRKGKSGGEGGPGGPSGSTDVGFDLPPDGEDEFDMSDLIGSIRKEETPVLPRQEEEGESVRGVSVSVPASRKNEKLDLRGVSFTGGPSSARRKRAAPASSVGKSGSASSDKQSDRGGVEDAPSKKERRKAHLKEKKKRKKNKGKSNDDDSDEDGGRHVNAPGGGGGPGPGAGESGSGPRQGASNDGAARRGRTASNFDDQVERPPSFSVLPRGAKKNSLSSKGKKQTTDPYGGTVGGSGGTMSKEGREKERRSLEALREHAMAQYAILRESRRNAER